MTTTRCTTAPSVVGAVRFACSATAEVERGRAVELTHATRRTWRASRIRRELRREPGAGRVPAGLEGAQGDLEDAGALAVRQAAEEAQLDEAGGLGGA